MSLVRAQFGEPKAVLLKTAFFYALRTFQGSNRWHPTEQSLFCRGIMINSIEKNWLLFLRRTERLLISPCGECCTMSLVRSWFINCFQLSRELFFMLSELFRARIGDTVSSYMRYRLGVALRMTVVWRFSYKQAPRSRRVWCLLRKLSPVPLCARQVA